MVKEITVEELLKMQAAQEDFQLIDVREADEVAEASIEGHLHIPLGEVAARADEVAKDKQVVIHCRSGRRSEVAAMQLMQQGIDNVYNLRGGILAYLDAKK